MKGYAGGSINSGSAADWSAYTGIKAWIKGTTSGHTGQYVQFALHEGNGGSGNWGDKVQSAKIYIDSLDANGQYVYVDFKNFTRYGGFGGTRDNGILELSDVRSFFVFTKWDGTPSQNSSQTVYFDDIQAISLVPGAGGTLDFDGSNDYVDVGNDASIKRYAASFTIEAWVNLDAYSTGGTYDYVEMILSNRGSGNIGSYLGIWGEDAGDLSYASPYKVGFSTGTSSGNVGMAGTSTIAVDTWYHVAFTFNYAGSNNNTGKIYVNGILEATATLNDINDPGTNSTFIGYDYQASNSAYHWDGMIDEVRVWSDVRTETEIRENMCKRLTGTEANLVGYWRFDESGGTSCTDSSPNSNTGTMTNMSLSMSANDRIWSGAPIGDASGYDYNGSTASDFSVNLTHSDGDDITATGTSGTFTGLQVYRVDNMPNYVHAPSGYNKIGGVRYWGVFPIGSATPTYTVTYNYAGHPGITDESTLKLAYRSGNSMTYWKDLAATLDAGANTLTKTGQTGTEYVIGSTSTTDNSLPVTLSYFDASVTNNGNVVLKWNTESEIDNLGFIVERREGGSGWTEIATYVSNPELQGQGSVTYRTEYSYIDKDVEEGKTYDYRLADVSSDGVKEYHATPLLGFTVIKPIPGEYSVLPAYPNPFNPQTTITFNLPEDQTVRLVIYDITGRMVKELVNAKYNAGSHSIVWNASEMGSGMYFYRLEAGSFSSTGKLALVK